MTIDERVRLAMSGLRLRTDETGRPPSHDEVEVMLRQCIEATQAEAIYDALEVDGRGTALEQIQHAAAIWITAMEKRYAKLPGLKRLVVEFAFEGRMYAYNFDGPGYSDAVREKMRAEAAAEFTDDDVRKE